MLLVLLGRCHTMEANFPLLEVISRLLVTSWSMALEETSSHIPILLPCTQFLLKSPLRPRQLLLYNKLLFFPKRISSISVILPITAMFICLLTLLRTLSTTVLIATAGWESMLVVEWLFLFIGSDFSPIFNGLMRERRSFMQLLRDPTT